MVVAATSCPNATNSMPTCWRSRRSNARSAGQGAGAGAVRVISRRVGTSSRRSWFIKMPPRHSALVDYKWLGYVVDGV